VINVRHVYTCQSCFICFTIYRFTGLQVYSKRSVSHTAVGALFNPVTLGESIYNLSGADLASASASSHVR